MGNVSIISGGGGAATVTTGYASAGGDNGTFATVKAAFDAGESLIEFLGDVVETTSITGTGGFPAEDVDIRVGAYSWTLAENVEFEDTAYNDRMTIHMDGGTFAWQMTVANNQALRCGESTTGEGSGKFVFQGHGNFVNTSTVDQSGINSPATCVSGEGSFKVTLPNKYQAFLNLESAKAHSVWGILELVGGGSSCYEAFRCSGNGNCSVDQLILLGTWSGTGTNPAIETPSIYTDINTIIMLSSGTTGISLGGTTKSINRATQDSQFGTLTLNDDAKVLGGDLMGFNDYVLDNDCQISNCNMEFEDISTVGTLRRVVIQNCYGWNSQNDDWTVDTEHSQYLNNRNFVSMALSGSENVVIGNIVGKNTGGGGGTGTIAITGDNNVVVGNSTDAAITNSGTGNQVSNNVEF